MTTEDPNEFFVSKPPPSYKDSRIPRGKYTRSITQSIQPKEMTSESGSPIGISKLPWPKSYSHPTRSVTAAECTEAAAENKQPDIATEAISDTTVPELTPPITEVSTQPSLDDVSSSSETSTEIDCEATTDDSDDSYDSTKLSTTDCSTSIFHDVSTRMEMEGAMTEGAVNAQLEDWFRGHPDVSTISGLRLNEDLRPAVRDYTSISPSGFSPGAAECEETSARAHEMFNKWVEDENKTLDEEIRELRETDRTTHERLNIQKQQTQELMEQLNKRENEYNVRWAAHEAHLKEENDRCRQEKAIAVANSQKLLSPGQTFIGLIVVVFGFVTFFIMENS